MYQRQYVPLQQAKSMNAEKAQKANGHRQGSPGHSKRGREDYSKAKRAWPVHVRSNATHVGVDARKKGTFDGWTLLHVTAPYTAPQFTAQAVNTIRRQRVMQILMIVARFTAPGTNSMTMHVKDPVR